MYKYKLIQTLLQIEDGLHLNRFISDIELAHTDWYD